MRVAGSYFVRARETSGTTVGVFLGRCETVGIFVGGNWLFLGRNCLTVVLLVSIEGPMVVMVVPPVSSEGLMVVIEGRC